jgi:hypothetical protein
MSIPSKPARVTLWIIQGLLAALFLFAGGFKLATPSASLVAMAPLPASFLKFIGACEVAGALGLILPGMLHIKEWLTPLAALGLSIIMTGAVVVTITTMGVGPAITPFVVGVLAVAVVFGRWAGITVSLRRTSWEQAMANG